MRNTLPVPADQYGGTPGDTYNYWDARALNPPAGAASATIQLLYQPTSWEYVQFLYLANDGTNAFLANEGINLLDAWLATGMAEPCVMASTTWTGTAQVGTLGDVNGDALVDSTDALILLSADAGFNTSMFCPMNCGDVSGDGYMGHCHAPRTARAAQKNSRTACGAAVRLYVSARSG